MIAWKPIAELPDELKDGRQVLCWIEGYDAEVLTWGRSFLDGRSVECWCDKEDGIGHLTVSHFAEINAPEGSANG